jgi:hypothetical protein
MEVDMVAQKRGAAVANLLTSRSRVQPRTGDSDWSEINRRIKEGRVIPIVSNGLRYDSIFAQLVQQASAADDGLSMKLMAENLLSQAWAQKINYPLPDVYELARVAQYNRSLARDDEQSKVDFLQFLKESLLGYAENLEEDADLINELYARINESSFSDLVQELEYPKLESGQNDPLRILARLPLPIYVTTSYHNFLERALTAENRPPVTQTCYWSGPEPAESTVDPDYIPTPERPLVYHLYGLETAPTTMVLSEDDFLDFLIKVTQAVDVNRPIIPMRLRSALATSSLILLGYRLQDWDFRILFRGIINAGQTTSRGFSLVIQLTPDQQFNIESPGEARKYLETYFRPRQFNVEWGDTIGFLDHLWSEWNKWRQGQ